MPLKYCRPPNSLTEFFVTSFLVVASHPNDAFCTPEPCGLSSHHRHRGHDSRGRSLFGRQVARLRCQALFNRHGPRPLASACLGYGVCRVAAADRRAFEEADELREQGREPTGVLFDSGPRWKKAIVVTAGPLMNFVLAVMLFTASGAIGVRDIAPYVEPAPASQAQTQGVGAMDLVTAASWASWTSIPRFSSIRVRLMYR